MSTKIATTTAPDFQSVLSSMDSVNAVRSFEEQINEELNLDAHKAALVAKLKATYAQHGTPVDESTIERGVDEFLSKRNTIKVMPNGAARWAALAYVRRGVIGQRVMYLFAVIALALWLFSIVNGMGRWLQRNRERTAMAATAKVEADKVASEKKLVQLEAQAKAHQQRDAAELAALPQRLKDLVDTITATAKEEPVKASAMVTAAAGIAQAKEGRLNEARQSAETLMGTLNQLSLKYELHINLAGSTPGSSAEGSKWVTGGWRRWNGQLTHYVVVNAVDPRDGRAIKVPVRNAETGQVQLVSRWAEEVTKPQFDAMVAEKRNTGRIANVRFASKEPGYMEPSYDMGVKGSNPSADKAGHRITKW